MVLPETLLSRYINKSRKTIRNNYEYYVENVGNGKHHLNCTVKPT